MQMQQQQHQCMHQVQHYAALLSTSPLVPVNCSTVSSFPRITRPEHNMVPCTAIPTDVPVPAPAKAERNESSEGCVGHPHSCAAPCKYFSKPRGCKDGDACKHCHMCDWRRHNHKEKAPRIKRRDQFVRDAFPKNGNSKF
jgi:hypothetical protein